MRVARTEGRGSGCRVEGSGGRIRRAVQAGFRGGLVFQAHRLVYHSTLGLRVIQKKKVQEGFRRGSRGPAAHGACCHPRVRAGDRGFELQGPVSSAHDSRFGSGTRGSYSVPEELTSFCSSSAVCTHTYIKGRTHCRPLQGLRGRKATEVRRKRWGSTSGTRG